MNVTNSGIPYTSRCRGVYLLCGHFEMMKGGYVIMKKLTYEEVDIIVTRKGFTLVTKIYLGCNQKLIVKDGLGFLYLTILSNIRKSKTLEKFNTCNPYTIQNIKLWCKLNNKLFELISDTYLGNSEKLQWKCLKDSCGEIFNMPWADIYKGHGCGVCHGFQVGLSNCLATLNPELAKEWHPIENGDLTPYDVTYSSGKKVWWKCKDNPKHEWNVSIHSRNKSDSGCPYCSHSLPSEDYNLLIINPELCEDWNYDKNPKSPKEYCPSSHTKVNWKCKECSYEWETSINNRINGDVGCPECNKSKGEKEIDNILIKNNWTKINQEDFELLDYVDKNNKNYFIPQKKFNGLLGTGYGLLSYDHYIPKLNLLIEFQGLQHEKFIKWFHESEINFKKQQEHDKRKREYALTNQYNFLEIWYYDKDNIKDILEKYIK